MTKFMKNSQLFTFWWYVNNNYLLSLTPTNSNQHYLILRISVKVLEFERVRECQSRLQKIRDSVI